MKWPAVGRWTDGCFWITGGYNPVCFFAPNTGYTAQLEYNQEGLELKTLIRALNENGD